MIDEIGKQNRRIDIEGLKTLAIINLFLFHVNHKFFNNGLIGVDIFFVISGYLARMTLKDSLSIRSIKNYIIKRIKRFILPYYFIFWLIIHIRLHSAKESIGYLSFREFTLTKSNIRNECVSEV